ncbi:MFS transporter [Streptomyces sp. NPDC048172]|uniref:MFS transporter n=1 Tax=Streptomyces sp. NPDC048172 TaxID=3365505 RepID=UPI00371AA11E
MTDRSRRGYGMGLGAEYRRIWTGNAASNLADGVTFVALPLLAADLTDAPAAVAGLPLAYTVPRILAVLGAGVLIDRADRRVLLHLSNFCRAAVFGVLTALVATEQATLVALYAVSVVMGVAETLSDNTVFAVLPRAVPEDGLDKANARLTGAQLVIDEFLGPPLGGLLFAAAAFAPPGLVTLAFLAAGVSYFLLKGDYGRDRDAPGPGTESGSRTGVAGVLGDIREGAAWTWRHALVRTTVVIGALASVGYMIPFSYLVLYAHDVLGLGPTGYGVLLSASALGGLAGAWGAARLRARVGYGWAIVAALALGSVSFAVIALTTHLAVVAVALAAYIGHAALWNVLAASVRQKATPDALRGRVIATTRLLSFCGLALGSLLGGWLAGALGLRAPFLVAGGLFAVAVVVALAGLRHFRAWEEETARAPGVNRASETGGRA